MGISTVTLPQMLTRCRDVSSDVRKLAFDVVAEKIDLKALTISQRVGILKQGLRDRSVILLN